MLTGFVHDCRILPGQEMTISHKPIIFCRGGTLIFALTGSAGSAGRQERDSLLAPKCSGFQEFDDV